MQKVVVGNKQVSVAELIGKGGEGEVFAIKGIAGQAVKIYNPKLRSGREDKVRAMVSQRLAAKTDLVAYPGEIVTDSKGTFLGFAMRLVSGYRPIHELYSPKSRQRHFPKTDYRFIVHAALNVARAIGKVHQTNCVIGDLNHSGVLVAPDATVALIDADSFQFNVQGKAFPCVVGVPEFTPPELHGKNLGSVQRTIEHDSFGLAVAIFHLLFMGRHPYAGRYNGPDISMGEAIAQNRFAFSLTRQTTTKTTPPPGALTLDLFPDAISTAFENAFGITAAARPSPLEWINSLKILENSLNKCSKVQTHYYPSTAGECVWCNLAAKSGYDMFPDLSDFSSNNTSDDRATDQAIREIQLFHFPKLLDLLPTSITPKISSYKLQQAKKNRNGRTFLGVLLIGAAISGFAFATPAWFIWIALGIWGGITLSDNEIETSQFIQAYKDSDERLQRELNAFLQRSGVTEVLKVYNDLDKIISSYKEHENKLAREIKTMQSSRETRQRQLYLDRFSLRRANISGIGPAKTATLISFGIETAADVNRAAIQKVPGFGERMADKLMTWRRALEAKFRYDPTTNAQDVIDEKALRGRFAAEKVKLESTIRDGLKTLRNAKAKLDILPSKARSDKTIIEAVANRAQAEYDLRELGVTVPTSNVALSTIVQTNSFSQPSNRPQSFARAPQTSINSPVKTPTSHKQTTSLISPTCPRCGSPMRRRSGRYGVFWGCTRYPGCKGTRNI